MLSTVPSVVIGGTSRSPAPEEAPCPADTHPAIRSKMSAAAWRAFTESASIAANGACSPARVTLLTARLPDVRERLYAPI